MGVRGLTTYINFNQDAFFKDYLLHDSNLVVDGHSLCAQLYISLKCYSAFGGDYDKYGTYVKSFFRNLKKCNITPYVLFDGSYEVRKLKTVFSRLRSKIHGAAKLDPITQGNLHIFPLFLRDVFKEVLAELNVAYTVCEFEADDEIAAMARHLKCPVLSYDSDFFIYNVLYIPFNTFQSKVKSFKENDIQYFALECKLYKVEYMTQAFGGLDEELLPLLATVLGNDYVEKRVFNKFFSELKLPKKKTSKNEQQRCIHGLFKWLQNETLETATAKIIGRLKKKNKARVFNTIQKSIAGYKKTYCRSLQYFNICDQVNETDVVVNYPEYLEDNEGIDASDVDEQSSNIDSTDGEDDYQNITNDNQNDKSSDVETDQILSLPNWYADSIRNECIPQGYINLYTNHLHFCSPQAEDYNDEDSSTCVIHILRYAFDILTDFANESFVYASRDQTYNYWRRFIGQEYATTRLLDKLYCELSDDELKMYLDHFLKEKFSSLDITLIMLLPGNFQLFMISLLWWVANCSVPLTHVHSLLLCYIMLSVIDEKIGTVRGYFYFNNKHSKKIEEFKNRLSTSTNVDEDLFLNKNKVLYEDCIIAASTLLKYFDIDESIKKRPKSYDVKKMHSFAQFQCCLQQFNHLNVLCRSPYECTKISKCFNGTFVYNLTLKLDNQTDPISFVEQHLKGATTVLMFYKSLCAVYEMCSQKMGLTTIKSIGKKCRRKRRKKFDSNDEISFIVKGFESELII